MKSSQQIYVVLIRSWLLKLLHQFDVTLKVVAIGKVSIVCARVFFLPFADWAVQHWNVHFIRCFCCFSLDETKLNLRSIFRRNKNATRFFLSSKKIYKKASIRKMFCFFAKLDRWRCLLFSIKIEFLNFFCFLCYQNFTEAGKFFKLINHWQRPTFCAQLCHQQETWKPKNISDWQIFINYVCFK